MNQLKEQIPEKFWSKKFAGNRPVVTTVGHLRYQLSTLPDSLPVEVFGADGVTMVVCNINEPTSGPTRPCLVLMTEE